MNSQQIVAKLWNYCNVLRDDGLSYGDYVEQFTLLVFLEMAPRAYPSALQGITSSSATLTRSTYATLGYLS